MGRLVDDTECRWQSLKRKYAFDYLEVQMESLLQLNGVEQYEKIAAFVGTGNECQTKVRVSATGEGSLSVNGRFRLGSLRLIRSSRVYACAR